jgi:CRP-like cAMP-binding protein
LNGFDGAAGGEVPEPQSSSGTHAAAIDPLYLLACQIEWERREEPSAAWELLAAAQSADGDTRAHARALLCVSHDLGGSGRAPTWEHPAEQKRTLAAEATMNARYGIEITEGCTQRGHSKPGFFFGCSQPALHALNQVNHKRTLPAGALLLVEGQSSRGMFGLCAGKVNLSTNLTSPLISREGQIPILKTAEAGEALGPGATISGAGYEVTAETATRCPLSFVDRKHLLELLQSQPEIGIHAAHGSSRDFQAAYTDVRDRILTRSSAGKLAWLLLAQSLPLAVATLDDRIRSRTP